MRRELCRERYEISREDLERILSAMGGRETSERVVRANLGASSQSGTGGVTMLSRKWAVAVVLMGGLFVCGLIAAVAGEGDTTWQILAKVDELLEKNPLAPGEKAQMIKIAEDDTITAYLIRMAPGAELGPHVHRTHDEIEYFIRGTPLLFVNDTWVEIRPGTIHFNPMGKAHGVKNTGSEPLVALIAFTPAMRETDRHFLK